MLFLYNLLFPLAFIFFVPGIIIKYIRRGGEKGNYSERFAKFAKDKLENLAEYEGAVWVHSVSVGETAIALSMINRWQEKEPGKKFILSTTTTTGQGMAVSKAPEGVVVIFCPIDFIFFVRKTIRIIKPSLLIIFETEIWPNLICEVRKSGAPVALVNARISDKSAGGYKRWSCFFAPILNKLSLLCVQTDVDFQRFLDVSKELNPEICGNMKFDQKIPDKIPEIDLEECFGKGDFKILLAASTHPGEEKLIADTFIELRKNHPELRLIIVPRHAERGGAILEILKSAGLQYSQRSQGLGPAVAGSRRCGIERSADSKSESNMPDTRNPAGSRAGADKLTPENCSVLLADTTGEMLAFMNAADIVVMGKSLAGQNEGHNIIEPALLGKPILTGCELRNFRFVLKVMKDDDALITVDSDDKLITILKDLLASPDKCMELGKRAEKSIEKHKGATDKIIKLCSQLLK